MPVDHARKASCLRCGSHFEHYPARVIKSSGVSCASFGTHAAKACPISPAAGKNHVLARHSEAADRGFELFQFFARLTLSIAVISSLARCPTQRECYAFFGRAIEDTSDKTEPASHVRTLDLALEPTIGP